MFKQWLLVSLSSVTFILVWGIVIIQFYHMNQPTLVAKEVPKIERNVYVKENKEINLPEQTVESTTETSVTKEIAMKDLRLVDFSDVIGPDGVSIDDVLNRLQLN